MSCENCMRPMLRVYGSGRFCDAKCARGFSTKSRRAEISAKTSSTLKRRILAGEVEPPNRGPKRHTSLRQTLMKDCPGCEKPFATKNPSKVCCSNKCAQNLPGRKESQSLARIEALKVGRTNHKSIRCEYDFRGEKIRCDSRLEYACLDWFERHHKVTKMSRSGITIEYDDGGQTRRYLPDFIIDTEAGTFIVECKSQIYSKSLSEKWYRYRESAPLKQAALRSYAEKNTLHPFWFEPGTQGSRYRSLRPQSL